VVLKRANVDNATRFEGMATWMLKYRLPVIAVKTGFSTTSRPATSARPAPSRWPYGDRYVLSGANITRYHTAQNTWLRARR
jgi:hypothetical protein